MILLTTTIEFTTLLILLFLLVDLFTGFKMIKSLFNRLRLKADNAAEAIRDPEADAHAALADIRQQKARMIELRKQILVSIGLAKSKVSKAFDDVNKYEQLAMLAGKAQKADDVKLALMKKAAANQKLADANEQLSKLTKQEDSLENKIAEFDALIDKAESDKEYLSSDLKINQFNIQVNEVLKSNGSALGAIDKLRADVDKSRIEAEVSGELSDDSKSLEARYAPANGVTAEDVSKYLTA